MSEKYKEQFQIKISSVGTNKHNGAYKIWKDKSAIKLMRSTIIRVAKAFVGKEHLNQFVHDVCITLFSELSKSFKDKFPEYTDAKIKEMIEDSWKFES